jgi:C-terminal processing protease CtpA/Prc
MRRTTPLRWLVLFAALFTLAVAPSLASARAWLGVYTQEVTAEPREALDLPKDGVLVSSVVADSPAERAGLRKGDVITEVDNRKVSTPGDLSTRIAQSNAGESVSLSVNRRGSNLILAVRLADRPAADDDDATPAPAPMAPMPPPAPRAPGAPHEMRWYSSNGDVDPDEVRARIHEIVPGLDLERVGPGKNMVFMNGSGRGRLGVRIETLSDDLAQALGAPGAHGALVVEVFDGTAAEKAGLKAGDVITTVDGTSVADTDDLQSALRGKQGKVSLSVVRRGEKRTLTAELEDSPRVIRLRDGAVDKQYWGPETKVKVHVDDGDDENADLQKQLEDLRQQLRELREELHKSDKTDKTVKTDKSTKSKK